MEPATTPTIWDTIGDVITHIISSMGDVASALMSNQIFQITLGVIFFGIVMGVVYSLVRKLKHRG